MLNIRKILKKIGAVNNNDGNYVPNEEQQSAFRHQKWSELKERYSPRKVQSHHVPFENELDEIVLDCWKYGEKFGRKTVWKKYRQNCDELTFDTLKVMKKKRT